MPTRFALGDTVITPAALSRLHPNDVATSLLRHSNGDWGDVDPEDRQANEDALTHHGRLFSVYYDRQRTKFWIITEADRSSTCVLLPEDY